MCYGKWTLQQLLGKIEALLDLSTGSMCDEIWVCAGRLRVAKDEDRNPVDDLKVVIQ